MTAALHIEDLGVKFGGLSAVDGITLSIPAGDRHLLLGPNGAGKTTLFNLINGDIRPTRGRVSMFGRDITRLPVHRRAHLGLGRTYQIVTLFPKNTLKDNVLLALGGLSGLRFNPITAIRGQKAFEAGAMRALESVGLAAKANMLLSETSYGEKRRLEIALALAQAPKVLLLDEPLAGLSHEERLQMQALVASIPRDVTIVLIEHDMDVALALAESVTVMQSGRLIVTGPRDQVVSDARVKEIYLAA
mgnify:CR=1 FL=1